MSVYILSVISLAVLVMIAVYITYKQVGGEESLHSDHFLANIFPGETVEAGGGWQADLEQPQHQPQQLQSCCHWTEYKEADRPVFTES